MRLLLFAACEKAISDAQTHSVSLISVMGGAEVRDFPGMTEIAEMPANAIIPMNWFIVALWIPSREEIGQQFKQRIVVTWPNGDEFTQATLPFTFQNERLTPSITRLLGFPAGQVGSVNIRMWVERDGTQVTGITEYPISVTHVRGQG